uniref:Uncharacterized protein n=1 Tax=Tetranychus urticae TaxID=32264 RepID=T1KSE5_TETUR
MAHYPDFDSALRLLLNSLVRQTRKVTIGALIRSWEWMTETKFPSKDLGLDEVHKVLNRVDGIRIYDHFFVTLRQQNAVADHIELKIGSYSYRDAGLFRSVEYIADENGFRAAIRANEPGLGDSNKELLASIYHLTEATPAMVASKVVQPLLASIQGLRSQAILKLLTSSFITFFFNKSSSSRVAPVAAARASVRQQRLRPQAICKLVSS